MAMVDKARVLSMCLLFAGLIGCGQKGPLYLPDKGGDVVTRPAGQTQQPSPQRQAPPQQPAPQPGTSAEDEKKNQPPPRQ
jgi:predicted small lipoprotein YifL